MASPDLALLFDEIFQGGGAELPARLSKVLTRLRGSFENSKQEKVGMGGAPVLMAQCKREALDALETMEYLSERKAELAEKREELKERCADWCATYSPLMSELEAHCGPLQTALRIRNDMERWGRSLVFPLTFQGRLCWGAWRL